MKKICIYGKGGIGKSTVVANVAAAAARDGKRVMVVGCDPKADTTRVLVHGRMETILDAHARTGGVGLTLADVRLETGRRHQIRVQHLLAGLPLWGDARSGGGRPGQQIALWAHSLTFEHPTLKTPVAIESLPPPEGAWRKFPEYASKNSPEYAKERFDV